MAQRKSLRNPTGVQLGEDTARYMAMAGAARVFADKGVRAATVDDILEAARIARRTFYRLFKSKEEIMLALYRFGVGRLLEACRQAVAEVDDPIVQVERFIDAHLRNARELGRLVFVLGGEAQRLESALHGPRMEAHQTLTELLQKGRDVDPLLLRGMILALEGVTRLMLEDGDEGRKVTDEAVARARRVMMRMATATVAGEGPGVAPMPTAPVR